MLNPDWPLAIRLLVVALAIAAAALSFANGSVLFGAIFTGVLGWVFNALFMRPPGDDT
ncbi:hypothetical protein [Aliigemmobacter aestuarii]|uniref:hypothetical protein n=1 Tax=Aliigemmobacter aestuarii TaxID=1445661 RepID=UPI001454DE11|nr:hypothetical protein [Gemmobacter aestuarii]